MNFQIEQIALYPPDPEAARELLTAMGAGAWIHDTVVAHGVVDRDEAKNIAELSFAYGDVMLGVNELEVLQYHEGPHWMARHEPSVSHLGMHVTAEDLEDWRDFFQARGIRVAQEVVTSHHTNPAIAGKRYYQYVIFDTRPILGVDLKFIVRRTP